MFPSAGEPAVSLRQGESEPGSGVRRVPQVRRPFTVYPGGMQAARADCVQKGRRGSDVGGGDLLQARKDAMEADFVAHVKIRSPFIAI